MHTVLINRNTEVFYDYIIVATGFVPAKQNFSGIDSGNIFYSSDMFSINAFLNQFV